MRQVLDGIHWVEIWVPNTKRGNRDALWGVISTQTVTCPYPICSYWQTTLRIQPDHLLGRSIKWCFVFQTITETPTATQSTLGCGICSHHLSWTTNEQACIEHCRRLHMRPILAPCCAWIWKQGLRQRESRDQTWCWVSPNQAAIFGIFPMNNREFFRTRCVERNTQKDLQSHRQLLLWRSWVLQILNGFFAVPQYVEHPKHEKKTRHKSDPHHQCGSDECGDPRIEITWITKSAKKANELHHHDERTRSCFCQS